MMLAYITPVILTYDEAANIERTLRAVSWAADVVILDSGSTDTTERIASGFPNVRFLQRPFDEHAIQWNFAVRETHVATPWTLCLDADYVMSPELVEELRDLEPPDEVSGYITSFEYWICGGRLKRSLYPPAVTLFRTGRGSFIQDGHTQRLSIPGSLGRLRNPIRHDDRKPLRRWLASQARYAELEALKLTTTGSAEISWPDKARKLVFLVPLLALPYCLMVKGSILDGWRGLYYAIQRTVAEMILSLELLHRRFGSRPAKEL